jgi:hypothetical protein
MEPVFRIRILGGLAGNSDFAALILIHLQQWCIAAPVRENPTSLNQ